MKTYVKTFVATIFLLMTISSLKAQKFTTKYTTQSITQGDVFSQLADTLIGPGVTRRPGGAIIPGTGYDQVGVFSNLVADVMPAFENGIIISTGEITDGSSLSNTCVNMEFANEGLTGYADPDLARHYPSATLQDSAGLVLYIQPRNKTINIPFLMASEGFYYPYVGQASVNMPTQKLYENRSDVFAFFLEPIGDAEALEQELANPLDMYNNIALMPDGKDVGMSTVNQYTNTEYFISNIVTNNEGQIDLPSGDIMLPMEFNGAIKGPVSVANVDPNTIYKLKIVIADRYDDLINSVLYLRTQGITSGANLSIDVSGPAILSEVGEVTYTNTVANLYSVTADVVVVTNYLPVGVNYIDVKDGISTDAGSITGSGTTVDGTDYFVWTLGSGFAPGSNAMMTVTCNLENPGTYTNRALVVTSTGDFDESNNRDECSTVVAAPDTRPMEFVVDKLTKMYDGTDLLPTYSYTTNALAPGHKLTEVVFDVESIRDVGKTNVNIVGFTVKEGDTVVTEKYTPAYTAGSLEVTKRKVALTSESAEKIYDGLPLTTNEVKVTGDGFADGEGATYAVTGMQTIVGESDNAFSYEFNVGTKQGNYDVDTTCGKLKVTAIVNPIVITVQGSSKKYDGTALTDESASFTYTDGVLVDGDELEVTRTDASITDVGTSNVTVKAYKVMRGETDVTGCYTFGDAIPGSLVVTERSVTLTSASAEKLYDGQPLTTNEVVVTGDCFVDGEGATFTVTGSQTDVGKSDNAFTYTLQDNTKAINYDITCVTGKLEVTKVVTPIKITVDRLTKQYDRQPLVATWTTEGNLLGDDVLTVTPSIPSITNVGSNDVTVTCCKVMRGTTDVTADYAFTIVPGSLEVTKRPLTVTARSNTKKYGTPTAFSGKEYTVTGGALLAGDKITQVLLTCKGCDKTAVYTDEGYPIEVKKVKGNGLENYDITTVNGVLKIVKLPLTVTADNTNKVYGAEVQFAGTEFQITDGTLVNGDTVTKVTLTSEGAAKNAAWKEGGYPIVANYPVDGKGAGNYDIAFLPGTLTVDKRKITITAFDTNKVYGTELELDRGAFKITEGDLAEGDTLTEVTLKSEGTVSNAVCLAEGEGYPLVPSHVIFGQIETNNYEIAFSNGTLTVQKADLTIAVNDAKWRIGRPKPLYSVADFSSQLKAGDTSGQITNGAEFTPEAYSNKVFETAAPIKGEYVDEIWLKLSALNGERASNYDISIKPGTLTVASAEAKFSVTLEGHENGWTGVEELTLKVTNAGDDPIDPEYDYWVELMPKTNAAGKVVYCICKGIGGDRKPIRTEHRLDGCDYIDLTAAVKAALGDGTFDKGDTVTITGVSFFHSGEGEARHSLESFIGEHPESFFVAGLLFNPSDTSRDFKIDPDELAAAAELFGPREADYIEVSRLSRLPNYHWDAKEANWVGPGEGSAQNE